MGRLNFKDIGDDWTPSAISIVDIPDHPLAVLFKANVLVEIIQNILETVN